MAELALAFALLLREPMPATLTHYGTGDEFLGQHHGAYWHGNSCGLPSVVDLVSYGVAAPRWVPYCTEVLVCYQEQCVIAVVADRMADDVLNGQAHLDLWPAAAQALGIVERGIVEGKVWIP